MDTGQTDGQTGNISAAMPRFEMRASRDKIEEIEGCQNEERQTREFFALQTSETLLGMSRCT